MNNCEQLHETVVKDIVDVISDIKDYDQIDWLNNKNNTGSIAKRASNLILVFPVLISSSLNINTAMIISKAIERKCTSLLQILFSSVQISNADNLQDYISQFHTNLNLKGRMDLDEFIGVMDKLVDEGAVLVTDQDVYNAVKEDMKNISYTLSESFNPVSVNDYKVSHDALGESTVVLEAPNDAVWVQINDRKDFMNKIGNEINKRVSRSVSKMDKSFSNKKDDANFFNNQLLDSDIKKANELMPTTMLVNFISTDGTQHISTTGIVGVKAKLYTVDSMEIINRITSKVKDKNGLFNLIRATTREISFFKDLAFAIDKAKLDAINMGKESNNAKMFKVLERRAAKNRFSSLMKKNNASPITSLVLSQEEVEYLKKYNNLDMEKSFNARTILESYNLMDIVIADESLEIARFLFDDGDGVYETLTFDSLEKEANDKSYKKVINLMSRINR